MWHYVYILNNQRRQQYIGHTEDLNMRLKEHNSGTVPATKNGRPWHIEWYCAFHTSQQAIAFEKHLKTGSGTAFRYRHFAPRG